MNFTYYMPTKILFGKGQMKNLHQEKLPGGKALIVTTSGKSVKKYGYLSALEQELDLAGVTHVLFDKVLPNPVKRHVMEGAELVRREKIDFIIGLGGGSSIDTAKAIAVMAPNSGDYWDFVSGGSGKGLPVPNDPLPVVAITTTAGTGTEADPWTVITKEDTDEKIGFGYEKTFPVLSVVDPDLMMTVPPAFTAYQGFDALFHSTEGYLNRTANPMSDLYAHESIRLLGKYLARAVENGADEEARSFVALANTLAGMVETTSGCISEHSIEHAMSAYHPNLTHGAGLIMISCAYYEKMAAAPVCEERMTEMARALGCSGAQKAGDFSDALLALQKACGVDGLKMSEAGITREELPDIAKKARDTMGGLFQVDPICLTDADVLDILVKSYR